MNRFFHSRFARAAVVYLAGVFLVVFGYANVGHLTDNYPLAVFGVAVMGTVLAAYLGFASGSVWSVLLLGVALVIAALPDTPLTRGDFAYGEGVINSLPSIWLSLTLIAFFPAWFVGRLLGYWVDQRLKRETSAPQG